MHRLAKPIVLSVGEQAASWKRKFKSGKKIQVSKEARNEAVGESDGRVTG